MNDRTRYAPASDEATTSRWVPTRLILFLSLLCSTSAPVFAQSGPAVRNAAEVRFGSLYLTPSIALQDLGIDTNVFNTNVDPVSDFTFTTRSRVASAYEVARVGFFAEGSYLNTRQRPNFEIDARSRRLERTVGAGVTVQVLGRTDVEFGYHEDTVEFDEDAEFDGSSLHETLNRTSRGPSAALRYAVTPLTSLVLSAEAVENRFPFSPVRDTDAFRLVPGVDFRPGAMISGSAHVGHQRIQAHDEALPSFSGTVAAVDLSYTLRRATTFTVALNRDVDYSYDTLEVYYVRDGYGGSIRRELGWLLDVTAEAARYEYNYRSIGNDPSSLALEGDSRDTVHRYAVSLGYPISGATRLTVGLAYWKRRSNRADYRNYDRLQFSTGLSYGLVRSPGQ